ncbi:MAG TPA: YciI family protein [Solirubrobacteraceae bacterium]|jgi:hypothetical protein
MGLDASHTVLIYDYVPDVLERRAPHREAHLAWLAEWQQDGRLIAAGVLGDPPVGALFILRADVDAEALMDGDPYIAAGIVTSSRTLPWTLAVR